MATPFVVACTHCSSKLKLKDQSKVGKKVRCPKCGEPFLIKAPKSKSSQAAADDDGGFYDDDFGDDDDWGGDGGLDFSAEVKTSPKKKKSTPAEPKAKSKKGGKKKRKRTDDDDEKIPGFVIAAVTGGSLLFLVALGVGIYFLLPYMKLPSSTDRFLWMPNDMETFVEVNAKDVWNSEMLKPVRTSTIGLDVKKKLEDQGSISIDDIETLTMGVPGNGGDPTVVIHSAKPVSEENLGNGESYSYAGMKLHKVPEQDLFAFLHDSKTIVVGPKTAIESAIDRQGQCSAAEHFKNVPSRGDVVFGSKSPTAALNSAAPMMGSAMVDAEKIQAVVGTLDISQNVDIEVTVTYTDNAAAQSEKAAAEEMLAELQKAIDLQQKQIEEFKENQEAGFLLTRQARSSLMKAEEILKNIKFSGSGSDMTVNARIHGSIISGFLEELTAEEDEGFMPFGFGF